MAGKSALLAGASGLVGGELLNALLQGQEYTRVISLVRKPLGIKHPKLEEQVVDFDDLTRFADCFAVADVFCCLGTTIKRAKSQAAFKKVDVDYPVAMAKIAKEKRVEKFLIISSMGASPESAVFYSRMKGLLEQQLANMGLKSLHIFRPSLLLGNRHEFRFGEKVAGFLAKGISGCFVGVLNKYRPIEAKTVAAGMYKAAQFSLEGTHIYLSNEIAAISNK